MRAALADPTKCLPGLRRAAASTLLALLLVPPAASAAPSVELIWTSTTGSGTPGTSVIEAANGDVLEAEIRLSPDAQGIAGYSISLEFDRDLVNELDLVSSAPVANPEWPIDLTTVPMSTTESTGSTLGNVLSYGAACAVAPPCGPTSGTYVIGTVSFSVNTPSSDGDDVFTGIFNTGADDIIASDQLTPLGLTATYLDAAVNAPPPAVPYAAVATVSASGGRSQFPADIDGDGDLDVVVADGSDASAWSTHTIYSSAGGPRWVHAADVDGDGDLDVLAAEPSLDAFTWYENDGTPAVGAWSRYVVDSLSTGARSAVAADVDGDGDLDLVTASETANEVAWFENDGTPKTTPWTFHDIAGATTSGPITAHPADVDGDGDLDVLAGSYNTSALYWFENDGTPASGTWTAHTVFTGVSTPATVVPGDVDGDGDLDAVLTSYGGNGVAWYENDGTPAVGTWTGRTVATGLFGAFDLKVADADADGDLDVLAASYLDHRITLHVNDGAAVPGWTEQELSSTALNATSVGAADLDGDGDLDVLGGASGLFVTGWFENLILHRSAAFPGSGNVGPIVYRPYDVSLGDLDGDGDLDVVAGDHPPLGFGQVRWYENTAGDGSAWTQATLGSTPDRPTEQLPADVDGDGDLDVLATAFNDDVTGWYENLNGDASSWSALAVIDSPANGPSGIDAADLDRDGELDVVTLGATDDTVRIHLNDGGGASWTTSLRTSVTINPAEVVLEDVNGDGAIDIVVGATGDAGSGEVLWLENDLGAGATWPVHTISSVEPGAEDLVAADFDGDGDVDAATVDSFPSVLVWHENSGDGSTWTRHEITNPSCRPSSLAARDLDADGDLDLVVTGTDGSAIGCFEVLWYENAAGDGSAWTEHMLDDANQAVGGVDTGDIDGDGKPDVVVGNRFGPKPIVWYANRGGQFSLPTTGAPSTGILENALDDVMRIDVTHEGRSGDGDLELVAVELRFEDELGAPLSDLDLDDLLVGVSLAVDNGDGVFGAGDPPVASLQHPFSLGDTGLVTLTGVDDSADVQVAQGTPRTYFVVLAVEGTASSASPNRFQVVHLTESSSTAQERDQNVALDLEYLADTGSGVVQALDPVLDQDSDGLSNQQEIDTTGTDPLDADTDGDGLSDGDEVNLHGSNPLATDTDGDGMDDAAEVAQGSDPTDPDADLDGVCDGADPAPSLPCAPGPDVCPNVSDPLQANSDAFPAGDVCQCGDVNEDGVVDATDLQIASEHLVGRTESGSFVAKHCNVIGPSDGGATDCDVRDLYVLERAVGGDGALLENACDAYQGL
jgi:hypothetical protein